MLLPDLIETQRIVRSPLVQKLLPDLNRMAARVLPRLPNPIHESVLGRLINRFFQAELDSGELSFMKDRRVQICVSDWRWQFLIVGSSRRLSVSLRTGETVDATLRADSMTFISLLQGEQDPDALFFARRLMIEGDVALGLEIKHFLDKALCQ